MKVLGFQILLAITWMPWQGIGTRVAYAKGLRLIRLLRRAEQYWVYLTQLLSLMSQCNGFRHVASCQAATLAVEATTLASCGVNLLCRCTQGGIHLC